MSERDEFGLQVAMLLPHLGLSARQLDAFESDRRAGWDSVMSLYRALTPRPPLSFHCGPVYWAASDSRANDWVLRCVLCDKRLAAYIVHIPAGTVASHYRECARAYLGKLAAGILGGENRPGP